MIQCASRDTVTAFRNNYTHPANYTSLLKPNGLEVTSTALHCIPFLQPAMSEQRTMAGMMPAHLQHSQHAWAADAACQGITSVACKSSNVPRLCSACLSALGSLGTSGFCRGTVPLLLQGKRIGVFRSYVNIPTNDQEIMRLFNQAVADLEAGGQPSSSLLLL